MYSDFQQKQVKHPGVVSELWQNGLPSLTDPNKMLIMNNETSLLPLYFLLSLPLLSNKIPKFLWLCLYNSIQLQQPFSGYASSILNLANLLLYFLIGKRVNSNWVAQIFIMLSYYIFSAWIFVESLAELGFSFSWILSQVMMLWRLWLFSIQYFKHSDVH